VLSILLFVGVCFVLFFAMTFLATWAIREGFWA